MKRLITILFLISISLLINKTDVYAASLNTETLVAKDMQSGRIFYEKDKDKKRLIASTTKVTTAITAIENARLENVVEVGEEVLPMYGSNIYLEKGENILFLDLLYGLMLRSGNDASVTIAVNTAKTEENFIKMMNDLAKKLNMTNTTYENPHGLDDDTKNYSTVNDLATVYSYAYQNKTFREIVKKKTYKTESNKKSYYWVNRCKLLKMYDKATGCKTGYTPSAKRGLVSSASNNGLDVVIASFNSIYDYDLHRKLYEDIFANYKPHTIINKATFKIKEIEGSTAYIKNSIIYPLTKDEENKITKKLELNKTKNFKNDEEIGKIHVLLNDEIIKTEPIYVKTKNISLFQKIKDFIEKIF